MHGKHRAPTATRVRLGAAALALVTGVSAAVVASADASATPQFKVRLDAGAARASDGPLGAHWKPDASFAAGGHRHAAGAVSIAGTRADQVLQSHRWGMTGYRIPVSCAGTYKVRMRFAETTIAHKGGRVFGVAAEGKTKIAKLDVFAAAGGLNRAITRSFKVRVKDSALNLSFKRIVEDPMVSAIVVTRDQACDATAKKKAKKKKATTPAPAKPGTTIPDPGPASATAASGFPDASNTGVPAGTSLTKSGSVTVTRNGAVIDALDVNGSIQVQADNVTIKRTRVSNPRGMAIYLAEGHTGLVIEDVELDGSGNGDGTSAVGYANFTMRRVHIHDFGEGPAANGNVLIEDSYMHDFGNYISQGAHQDGIQMEWGDNMTIRHNTILMNVDGANAAVWVSGNSHSNVTISNNLLAGATYTIGLGNQATAVNNKISTRFYPKGGYYGPFTYAEGSSTRTGNVFYESGNPA
jgi:hypothetical protein